MKIRLFKELKTIPHFFKTSLLSLFCVKGYFKLLGKGVLPKQPLIVKAKFFSRYLLIYFYSLRQQFFDVVLVVLRKRSKLLEVFVSSLVNKEPKRSGVRF